MKKLNFGFWVICLLGLLSSCDRIANPIPIDRANYDVSLFPGNYASDYNYPNFGPNPNNNVNVLVEDFTGHQCGNCPQAGVTAKNVEAANSGRVFSISMHAGAGGVSQYQRFNRPEDTDYPKYSRNFTNDASLAYATSIPGLPGNPFGLVNRRTASGTTTPWLPHGQWQQNVQSILQENELHADLQAVVNYYPETSALFVHIEAEAKAQLNGNYNLVVYAIAREVEDWQKNYGVFPPDIPNYKHHHVHIGNVNGIWGVPIMEGETPIGTKVRQDYTYIIREDFRGFDYAIVAYIMNADTYEILQVIMINA